MAGSPTLPAGYSLHSGYPLVADYLRLRSASGLSSKTAAQAEGALSGSWYGCYVKFAPPDCQADTAQVVAMGRCIGDGGWCFHIADMAVLPEHQRRGLGDAILKDLLARIDAAAAEGERYISLFAEAPGRKLYANNGFAESSELGMVLRVRG